MAGKKQKCPDCGAKLKKGEQKGSRSCPDCLLLIDNDGHIVRPQSESIDESGAILKGLVGEKQPEGAKVEKLEKITPLDKGMKFDVHHVSKSLQSYPHVTVYGWKVGHNRVRYSTKPIHSRPDWEKKMSGVDAYQFLRHIKRSNRRNRLETTSIPKGDTLKELMNI